MSERETFKHFQVGPITVVLVLGQREDGKRWVDVTVSWR